SPLLEKKMNWLEIIITIFSQNLLKEWLRDHTRGYETISEVGPIIRGKLDIADQIRVVVKCRVLS
ncbi:MAG: hypothetical protein EOO39_19205, partial [Cytophagaceae bacterium]